MAIIEVNDVSICFNLAKEKTDSIKEYVLKALRHQLHFDEFWALKNINIKIEQGESWAIIGRNGSGKSTLLKIIAGVLAPTKGNVIVHGSIAPLIELGAGFDPELTARENIYMNGAIMGYDRKFMNAHFEEIVDFSELKDFLDVQVKNFSTGMVARLGFSIATVVDAEILIVDEVLSVGDAAFQEKCERKMDKLLSSGTTLIFVSHSADKVMRLCKNTIWIDQGNVKAIGDSESVYSQYYDFLQASHNGNTQ